MKIELNKKELRALLAFSTKDRGVLVDAVFVVDGKIVVTDGHTLVTRTAENCDGTFALTTDFAKQAYKMSGAKDQIVIRVEEGFAICEAGGKQLRGFLYEEKCPPIEQVIPARDDSDRKGTGFIGLNPSYLARLQLVQDSLGTKSKGMRFQMPSTPLEPIRADATSASGAQWEAVIMPCRLA